jgi:SAM-dependent methyltransferase
MAISGGREAQGSSDAEYWDQVVAGWQQTPAHRLWRAHSDAVNIRLLRRWLPLGSGRLLKTDLFDEAVGEGLYPELARRAEHVIGVDVSSETVERARARHPGLEARVADVLALPFETAGFDTVVSNSTLDHFEQRDSLVASMAELARVTRSGGRLIITLDNRSNPVIALRTSRQLARLHRWLRVVPYFVGVTCGPRALRRHLSDVGFDVMAVTAIMHWPPQLSANRVVRRGQVPQRDAYLAEVLSREFLERWPTRYLTGHFVAACALRR